MKLSATVQEDRPVATWCIVTLNRVPVLRCIMADEEQGVVQFVDGKELRQKCGTVLIELSPKAHGRVREEYERRRAVEHIRKMMVEDDLF